MPKFLDTKFLSQYTHPTQKFIPPNIHSPQSLFAAGVNPVFDLYSWGPGTLHARLFNQKTLSLIPTLFFATLIVFFVIG